MKFKATKFKELRVSGAKNGYMLIIKCLNYNYQEPTLGHRACSSQRPESVAKHSHSVTMLLASAFTGRHSSPSRPVKPVSHATGEFIGAKRLFPLSPLLLLTCKRCQIRLVVNGLFTLISKAPTQNRTSASVYSVL